MSCRRSDKARLIGCKIGDVALRGCSRGCCPYPDSEVSFNTREHLLRRNSPEHHPPASFLPGRTGLYYRLCQSEHRPKFICPSKPCRRSIKPFYDAERFEYRISKWQCWDVRPREDICPEIKEAAKRKRRMNGRSLARSEETIAFQKLVDKFYSNPESLTEDETRKVKSGEPEAWWIPITIKYPREGEEPKNTQRCPSCGKEAVPVGSNFEIPAKKNDKAWKEVENLIAEGEDMVARFSSCWTVEEHEERFEEANRLRQGEINSTDWEVEKRRRVEETRS